MESESKVSGCCNEMMSREAATGADRLVRTDRRSRGVRRERVSPAVRAANLPAAVKACVAAKPGEYDARRLRSQRDVIRDVMLAAADCATWLTLAELRALTRFGEASISAQLRHLRKAEHGGYEVVKRHRDEGLAEHPGLDRRGECFWEYRIARE
jgi:glutamine synthetase adenylyltransferase